MPAPAQPGARAPRPFSLETPAGATLHGTIDPAAKPGPRPTVVVCHGFKGFQEWAFLPYLAELLAARGFTAVRFNLSGSGMLPGDELVTDLDAFRRATPSRDLEELLWLVENLGRLDPELIDGGRVGLFGHSRGGATSALAAADGNAGDRIRAVVTWAAVSTFDRAAPAEKEAWRERGVLPVLNTRTGQELPVGVELLDDVENSAERLDVEAAASRITAPWLIVHGAEDETVPADEGRRLATAGSSAELLEIPAAGHSFGAVHPFAGPTPELITALNATQTWFRRHLG